MELFDAALQAIVKLSKTRFNYWAEFAVDIPLGVMLTFAGLRNGESASSVVLFTIGLGLFLFSFFEYIIHRRLFHGSVQIFVRGHWAHHENPSGYDALPFFLPALILLALTGVLVLLMPASHVFLLTGSIAFGYVVYGLSHFAIHHHRFHRLFARDWAANHHIHHYHPDTNFGVTTPLWDMIFGTRYIRSRKK